MFYRDTSELGIILGIVIYGIMVHYSFISMGLVHFIIEMIMDMNYRNIPIS